MQPEFSINFTLDSDQNIKVYLELPKTAGEIDVIEKGNRIAFALNMVFAGKANEYIRKALIVNKRDELSNYVNNILQIKDLMTPVISPSETFDD